MTRLAIPTTLIFVLVLATLAVIGGCTTVDRNIPVKPRLAPISSQVMAECLPLPDVPDRDLRAREAARMWQGDRNLYRECAAGKSALISSVKAREAIQGAK